MLISIPYILFVSHVLDKLNYLFQNWLMDFGPTIFDFLSCILICATFIIKKYTIIISDKI